eukprot:2496014-Amphidinium_carterae.1
MASTGQSQSAKEENQSDVNRHHPSKQLQTLVISWMSDSTSRIHFHPLSVETVRNSGSGLMSSSGTSSCHVT